MSPDLALSLPIPALLVQLLLLLTLPIALGMWVRRRRTDLAWPTSRCCSGCRLSESGWCCC